MRPKIASLLALFAVLISGTDAQGRLTTSTPAPPTAQSLASTPGNATPFVTSGSGLISPQGSPSTPPGIRTASPTRPGVEPRDQDHRAVRPERDALGSFAFSNVNSPSGIAFDTAGNLYVAKLRRQHRQPVRRQRDVQGPFAFTHLNGPAGLAFDASGNLYVVNSGDNTVEKFSASGTDLGPFIPHVRAVQSAGPRVRPIRQPLRHQFRREHDREVFGQRDRPRRLRRGTRRADRAGVRRVRTPVRRQHLRRHDRAVRPRRHRPGRSPSGLDGPMSLAFAPRAVPEPESLTLIVSGLVGLAGYARRRPRDTSKS